MLEKWARLTTFPWPKTARMHVVVRIEFSIEICVECVFCCVLARLLVCLFVCVYVVFLGLFSYELRLLFYLCVFFLVRLLFILHITSSEMRVYIIRSPSTTMTVRVAYVDFRTIAVRVHFTNDEEKKISLSQSTIIIAEHCNDFYSKFNIKRMAKKSNEYAQHRT